MVTFQRDEQFDSAASYRIHNGLGARLDTVSTKADGCSTSTGDYGGCNSRCRITSRRNLRVIEILGWRERI
jgi:hypothetical protein